MFGGRQSIQLARVFGIRVGVNTSWFLVLFFFIFILSGSFRDTLSSSDSVAYITAVASALSFFASLILHELGHALVARRLGIGISGIDLWMFGGVAKMTRDTDSPGEEFKVAIAGPAVTLLVVGVCVGAGTALAGWHDFYAAARLQRGVNISPVLLLITWLATINAALLLFNLVPAFPLDGGRIVRAIAWRRNGDRVRATRVAAGLGQGFGYLLIGLGVLTLVTGRNVSIGGLWSILLGWFITQAARVELAHTAFSERIGDVTVADIMDREPVSVPASLSVDRALDEYFLRYRWPWFPVVNASGRFVGLIRSEQVEPAAQGPDMSRTVGDLMEIDAGDWHVGQDAPLETLLGSEPLRRIGALMAVDPNGVLRGVVTLDQVRRALQSAAAPPVV